MNSKNLLMAVLFFISGLSFAAIGIYFLSKKFLNKLNESKQDPKNAFRAKGSGYTAIGLGALTIVFGAFSLAFSSAATIMALIYLFILMLAVVVLIIVFR